MGHVKFARLGDDYFQGVFEIDKDTGITLTEIGEGFSVEDVKEATGCELNIVSNLQPMRQA